MINSIEKKKAFFANSNIEVLNHGINNRMNMLIPYSFHETLKEKVLADKLSNEKSPFCPGKFLKEWILDQITFIKMLVMGNITGEQAKQFC